VVSPACAGVGGGVALAGGVGENSVLEAIVYPGTEGFVSYSLCRNSACAYYTMLRMWLMFPVRLLKQTTGHHCVIRFLRGRYKWLTTTSLPL